MKSFILLALLLSSTHCFALKIEKQTKEKLFDVTKHFLTSVETGNKDLYQKSVSKKFYDQQHANGFVKKAFSKKKNKDSSSIDFDFKIKKGAVDKDFYFVNFKEKKDRSYSDTWLIIKKNLKGSFVIDGIHHFED